MNQSLSVAVQCFYLLEGVVAVLSWLFAMFLDVPMYLPRKIFEVFRFPSNEVERQKCIVRTIRT